MEALRQLTETLGTSRVPSLNAPRDDLADALELAHLLVDVGGEPQFDESVQLTASLLGFPMAAISVVGTEEQVFKAKVGLDVSHTPIEQAFCAYTVRQPDVMVVSDAYADDRFQDNPLVYGEPGIRSYAGAPLILPEGRVVGALCVLDTEPREVSATSRLTLQLLARQVCIQMRLEELIARQARDILKLRLARGELAYMAMHDSLSALLNRRGIVDHLSEVLTRVGTGIDGGATLLFIDLDGFKAINDTFGHDCGDRVLSSVARSIKNAIPSNCTAGRLGGDEFVVVIPGIEKELARELGAKINDVICEPIRVDHRSVRITASIGIACGDAATLPSDLITTADRAMYRAKQAGGDQVLHAFPVRA